MEEEEESAVTKEDRQKAALDVYKPQGALVESRYLNRSQDIIGVNKSDLEDLLDFDGLAALFSGAGMFLLSGASWLLFEKGIEELSKAKPEFTAVIGTCIVCILAGGAFLAAGIFLHRRKRSKIKALFGES